ncbi:MAG: peroxiredoxin [Chitinophagales bacterium]
MNLRLGDIAPDFNADTTEGPINFYKWAEDKWVILFSHPADFTPVCTTELGAMTHYVEPFAKRNTKVIAISVDPLSNHTKWIKDIESTQSTLINYPIIADPDKIIATLYGMIHRNDLDNATVRSVFIIAPDKKIKLTISYPASTGRNFEEILRVLDSLQLTANYSVSTPVNWKDGEDVIIIPAIKDEDIPAKFPKGHTRITPYLRITPQPNK